jgi:hypothetical protein
MKRVIPIFLFTALILLSNKLIAQDTLIISPDKVVLADILEIGIDEIKYIPYEEPGSPVLVVDKAMVVKVITEEGKEYTFLNRFDDPALYANQRKNAIKFGLFSLLFGSLQFSYEHSIKPGRSMDFTLGIIGIGADVAGIRPRGVLIKAGYKFINTPDFYMRGMRYSHILKGFYVKPELIISTFGHDEYNYFSSYEGRTYRRTLFSIAGMLNIGKQWIFSDVFLIDIFFGAGFGFSSEGDFNYLYGFVGGYNSFPIALTGGLKLGFLFR